ncbi:hypothetical protein U1Q18_046407 [Sarracenia purpurea var. burkii]
MMMMTTHLRSRNHHLKSTSTSIHIAAFSLSVAPSVVEPFLTPLSHHHLSAVESKDLLIKSYTVTLPIKPWPQRLYPKRLVFMITRQQNLDLVLQIFDHACKYHPGFQHNHDTYHAIIHKLTRARVFGPIETLLAQLHQLNIKCGENLFITILRNCSIASWPERALRTFLRIKNFGVERSVRSFNTLLNALIQNHQYDLAHALFKNCRKKFDIIPNVFTCNILIRALCKKNDVENAIRVLDEMPSMGMIPNVVTYTTILGGYVSRVTWFVRRRCSVRFLIEDGFLMRRHIRY